MNKSYDFPRKQLKTKLSHLGQTANIKTENLLWTVCPPHDEIKSELTSGQQDTSRRSKEPTVITTANGKAELTEEGTVYVNLRMEKEGVSILYQNWKKR